MAKKIGLLVEGGGMKCAFSAGVLDVFLEEDINFDVCYGISAGSANSASFLAKQRGRNKRFYLEHSDDPRYYGLKNYFRDGSLFGLEFVYGELSRSDGLDPLDYEAIIANPCEFVMVATNERGHASYFTKDDLAQDYYEPIMASSALPALCRPIKIGDTYYFDGGVSDSLPIDKMIEDGCDKIVYLSSKHKGFIMKPTKYEAIYSRLLKEYPDVKLAVDKRYLGYNRSINEIRTLEADGKVFSFYPSPQIPLSTYNVDKEILSRLYDNGVDCAKAKIHRLKRFLDD